MPSAEWDLIVEAQWWANFAWQNKEIIGLCAAAALPMLMAFSSKQRMALKERDFNHCQATGRHHCNEGDYPLEVDHIIPQAYAKRMGLDVEFIDAPENALTKCKAAHDMKHPERVAARHTYGKKKQAGEDYNMHQDLQQQAREKLDHKQPYWNTANDRTDHVRALQLTQRAKKNGWEFPPPPKKRGEGK